MELVALFLVLLFGAVAYALVTRPPAERLGVRARGAGKNAYAFETPTLARASIALTRVPPKLRLGPQMGLGLGLRLGSRLNSRLSGDPASASQTGDAHFDEVWRLTSARDDVSTVLGADAIARTVLLRLARDHPKLHSVRCAKGKLVVVFKASFTLGTQLYEAQREAVAHLAPRMSGTFGALPADTPEQLTQTRRRQLKAAASVLGLMAVAWGVLWLVGSVGSRLPLRGLAALC